MIDAEFVFFGEFANVRFIQIIVCERIDLRVTLRDVTGTKLVRPPILGSAGSGRFLRKEVFCD